MPPSSSSSRGTERISLALGLLCALAACSAIEVAVFEASPSGYNLMRRSYTWPTTTGAILIDNYPMFNASGTVNVTSNLSVTISNLMIAGSDAYTLLVSAPSVTIRNVTLYGNARIRVVADTSASVTLTQINVADVTDGVLVLSGNYQTDCSVSGVSIVSVGGASSAFPAYVSCSTSPTWGAVAVTLVGSQATSPVAYPGCDGAGANLDVCNVCGGDGLTCIGCDGIANSGLTWDKCGTCGGTNTACVLDPAGVNLATDYSVQMGMIAISADAFRFLATVQPSAGTAVTIEFGNGTADPVAAPQTCASRLSPAGLVASGAIARAEDVWNPATPLVPSPSNGLLPSGASANGWGVWASPTGTINYQRTLEFTQIVGCGGAQSGSTVVSGLWTMSLSRRYPATNASYVAVRVVRSYYAERVNSAEFTGAVLSSFRIYAFNFRARVGAIRDTATGFEIDVITYSEHLDRDLTCTTSSPLANCQTTRLQMTAFAGSPAATIVSAQAPACSASNADGTNPKFTCMQTHTVFVPLPTTQLGVQETYSVAFTVLTRNVSRPDAIASYSTRNITDPLVGSIAITLSRPDGAGASDSASISAPNARVEIYSAPSNGWRKFSFVQYEPVALLTRILIPAGTNRDYWNITVNSIRLCGRTDGLAVLPYSAAAANATGCNDPAAQMVRAWVYSATNRSVGAARYAPSLIPACASNASTAGCTNLVGPTDKTQQMVLFLADPILATGAIHYVDVRYVAYYVDPRAGAGRRRVLAVAGGAGARIPSATASSGAVRQRTATLTGDSTVEIGCAADTKYRSDLRCCCSDAATGLPALPPAARARSAEGAFVAAVIAPCAQLDAAVPESSVARYEGDMCATWSSGSSAAAATAAIPRLRGAQGAVYPPAGGPVPLEDDAANATTPTPTPIPAPTPSASTGSSGSGSASWVIPVSVLGGVLGAGAVGGCIWMAIVPVGRRCADSEERRPLTGAAPRANPRSGFVFGYAFSGSRVPMGAGARVRP